jgi:hypothetical protein
VKPAPGAQGDGYITSITLKTISRERLASYAGVSERHSEPLFCAGDRLAPGSYFNRYRIRKLGVCWLSKLSITEVMGRLVFRQQLFHPCVPA